jgi:uncharacterized BrkB/YihY/UPF0761 family membrane protein
MPDRLKEIVMRDRTKIALWIGIPLTAYGGIIGIVALKHHVDAMYQDQGVDQADKVTNGWITAVAMVLGLVAFIGIIIAITWISSQITKRNAAFEESIAHLQPEDQLAARRRRNAIQAAMVVGGSLAAHELMKHRERLAREDLEHTRERNEDITRQSHHYYEDMH